VILSKAKRALLDAGKFAELRATMPTPKPRTRVRPVNTERKSKEFRRTYYSVERVLFIQALHCIVDGCDSTESEAAHVCDDGSKGMSRKSGYKCTAPACRAHHHEMDEEIGKEAFAEKYGLDLALEAAKTQRAWLRYSGEEEDAA
jgi:hypothetical protein